MKEKKLKEIQESELLIRKIISKTTDENGRTIISTKWFKSEEPINLGSFTEPQNKEIVEYKYNVPSGEENIFTKIFKGR